MTPFMMFVSFLGGLALLLYGFSVSGKALEEATGTRLRIWMGGVLKSRLVSALFGVLLTVLFQSSSATTVILVGLAQAGALSTLHAIPILLGADIGTALTVQLIALDIYAFSPLMIAVGFFIASYTKKKIGTILLGFGFVFFGLHLMIAGFAPISSYPFVVEGLHQMQEWPLLVIGMAALLTALFHSSAATLGIALAMGSQGILTIHAAVPIILGANMGTCVTALMAGFYGSVEARRVAVAHCLLKFLGVMLLIPFMTPFADMIAHAAPDLPRQIAHAHTFFNVGLLVLFLPLSAPFALWVTRWVEAPDPKENPAVPKYLDPQLIERPAFALEQAALEVFRMASIVREMLQSVNQIFTGNDPAVLRAIRKQEDAVDHLNREIKLYLIKLSSHLSEKESRREMILIQVIGHLENIGDIIDNNLLELGKKKIEERIVFSDEGLAELHRVHQRVCGDFDDLMEAIKSDQQARAEEVLQGREVFHDQVDAMRAAHIERLHHGHPSVILSSAVHLDILTHLARIRSHMTAIARVFSERDRS